MTHGPSFLERLSDNLICIGNDWVRFQFDLRTSDTMYNYVWLRRSPDEAFRRLHNFGVDIQAPKAGETDKVINTVGINLPVRVIAATAEAVEIELTYPAPTLQYRQLEKARDLAAISNYPDLPADWAATMVHADTSLAIRYRVEAARPAVTLSGRVLKGTVRWFIPILNAMWVDNRQIPTHLHIDGHRTLAYDAADKPDQFRLRDIRYCLYYNPDGSGFPFAAVFNGRQTIDYPPFVNNGIGRTEFYTCSTNQDFIPEEVPGEHWNDVNFDYDLREVPEADPITWVFFPGLSDQAGVTGAALEKKLVEEIGKHHLGYWQDQKREPHCEEINWEKK